MMRCTIEFGCRLLILTLASCTFAWGGDDTHIVQEKDLEDIPKYVMKDMEFIPVETMDEVLKAALPAKGRKKTSRRKSGGK